MRRVNKISRRAALAGVASLALRSSALAATRAQAFVPPLPTDEDKAALPVIPKTVVKMFNLRPRIKEPNALQFAPDGKLWVLDQVDPNKAFLVNPEDGAILREIQTEGLHGSGITLGHGAMWIGSTKGDKTHPPSVLKVDPDTGRTLKRFETPGWGLYGQVTTPSGAHGIRWEKGRYWMAVPAAHKIFLMEPESGKIARWIPAPTERTHDLALDDEGFLWCVGTGDRQIYKLEKKTGKILARIKLTPADPEPHGMDYRRGEFWYCDAGSGWFCKLV